MTPSICLIFACFCAPACATQNFLTKSDQAVSPQCTKDLPVDERIQPGFETPETRIGDFMIKPSTRMVELFDSNILATKQSTKSDFITVVAPQLDVQTIDPNHGFRFSAGSQSRFYKQHTDENTNDYNTSISPYWLFTRSLKMTAKASWEQGHELRTDQNATPTQGAEEPTTFHQTLGNIGLEYKPGRVGFNLAVERAYYSFENTSRRGGRPDFINNDRDRYEDELTAEMNCDITDRSLLYWRNKIFDRNYRRNSFDPLVVSYSGPKRDSGGLESVFGLRFPLTHLINFDGNAGMRQQGFNDVTYKDVTTPIGKAKVVWLVTPLTTIDLNAERQVYETTQTGASVYIQNKAELALYHELRRNIILDAGTFAATNHYTGFNRSDDVYGGNIGVTYKMNRYIGWQGSYAYDTRISNVSSAEYRRHRVFVTAKVEF
jgi:hypothetical protein